MEPLNEISKKPNRGEYPILIKDKEGMVKTINIPSACKDLHDYQIPQDDNRVHVIAALNKKHIELKKHFKCPENVTYENEES